MSGEGSKPGDECSACDGSGRFVKGFGNYAEDRGECSRCGGTGVEPATVESLRADLDAARAANLEAGEAYVTEVLALRASLALVTKERDEARALLAKHGLFLIYTQPAPTEGKAKP